MHCRTDKALDFGGTVVPPGRAMVTPGTSSTIAISMSVAVSFSTPSCADSSTLARMGMVFFLSTMP